MAYEPLPPLGQALKAASLPVTIASDQGISTSAKQDTIIGHVDNIEGYLNSLEILDTARNTKLDTLITATDTLEASVDGVETLIGSTNTKLDTLIGQTDILESNTTATNTKLDTLITQTDTVESLLTTIDGRVDGIETLLTTIEGDTTAIQTSNAAIQTAVEILDNAIAGNEMQVDVVAALPAGNNNIGDVDVATLPAVHFQDVYVTGQGSQLALNQNIILASAGTGSYDTLNGTTGISFRSLSLQITPAAGTVTAGVITFEGSNDNTNFVQVFLSDNANITAVPVATVTLAASTPRHFVGSIPFRYFRARISTGITGTTTGVQAHTVFSTIPFSSPRLTVSQATAGSMNVTATVASTTITSQVPGTAATNLGKARDSAIGATDTGVAVLGVRRDTPTAETPVAGDYVVPQISAFGEQWVRLQGEVADDSAFTVATTRVLPIAFMADETATDSVDEGDAGIARMTLDRKQIVSTYAHAAGGSTPYKLISAATTNATSVKASAGTLYMITASNVNAAVRYLKLYNKASAPTVGTDVPVFTFAIPGNTAGAGTNIPIPNVGINFSTGIAFALTTEITDTGATAVAASEISINLAYA